MHTVVDFVGDEGDVLLCAGLHEMAQVVIPKHCAGRVRWGSDDQAIKPLPAWVWDVPVFG